MSYTNAELLNLYEQLNIGSPGSPADRATVEALAQQTRIGQLSDAQALQATFNLVDDTTGVAALTYQFFTGGLPTEGGFQYLVNSATNTADLNDAYYNAFNQENRFINFSLNLALAGEGAAAFAATYGGSTTLEQAIAIAYEKIIGTAAAEAAGVDVDAAIDYLSNDANVAFYRQLATERAGISPSDPDFDLAVKAIAIAEILNAAVTEDLGNYASALNQFYGSLTDGVAGSPGYGNDLLETFPPAATVTLTANPDDLVGNVFNAPRVFTPGGNEQLNSLNDDDVLTGVGTNPTLNVTIVNETDNFDASIAPTLNNIQTVNVDFRVDSDFTLDLQDADNVQNLKLTGIDNPYDVTIDNVNFVGDFNLTIAGTSAPTSDIAVLFDEQTVNGGADTVNGADEVSINLDNTRIGTLTVEAVNGLPEGFESVNLDSTGGNNQIGTLSIEDAKILTITGTSNLTLGSDVRSFGPTQNQEATWRTGGLDDVAGSLVEINASTFAGNLDITLGAYLNANIEGTSGDPVNFKFTGGLGNDTVRLQPGVNIDAQDSLDGGAGDNTLYVTGNSTIAGSAGDINIVGFQHLQIRTGHDNNSTNDTVNIDASRITDLEDITVRNEGSQLGFGGNRTSVDENAAVVVSGLTAENADFTVLHGTSNNNGLNDLIITATHATGEDRDTTFRIGIGDNVDGRFNFRIAGDAEQLTIDDADNEENSIRNQNYDLVQDLIVTGGTATHFLNLDTSNGTALNSGAVGIEAQGGLYGLNMSGSTAGDLGTAVPGGAIRDIGNTAEAERYDADINATAFIGDLVVRVGNTINTSQTIALGSGNDTVIFDTLNDTRAGLTISDTVSGGAGTDTLAIDGDGVRITLGASEWTHVSEFEVIRLVGNNFNAAVLENIAGLTLASKNGDNAYNLTLTNELLASNGVASGSGKSITIVNDNGTNAAEERGVTIDARGLSANNSFVYDGEEGGAGATADRFILADANINGSVVINGGGNDGGHNDVLEVRNAAVVTIGDLVGISNIENIMFTNDTSTDQSSVLELDNATVERMALGAHPLNIIVQGNPGSPTSLTELTIEDQGVAAGGYVVYTDGPGNYEVTIVGNGSGSFVGGVANDLFNGGEGNENISGGDGNDTLFGNGGNDTISGGNGADTIDGGDGNDVIDGGAGADSIDGGAGNDSISGGSGVDTINGGDGNDTIVGGAGSDVLTGGTGTGADVFVYGNTDATFTSLFGVIITPIEVITDFSSAQGDKIDFTGSSLLATAGTATNYGENTYGSVTAALAGANAFFDGTTTTFFLGQVGANSFLFVDQDLSGTADNVIQLTGVTLADFAYTDII